MRRRRLPAPLGAGRPGGAAAGAVFARIARRIAVRLDRGAPVAPGLVAALRVAAPSAAHRRLARDLAAALAAPCPGRARRIASTARRTADARAEKIVSRRHRFVWLGNPKVASRSLIAALLDADPDARLVEHASVRELYATYPEARRYFAFAFLRDPCERTLSFYRDKYLGGGAFERRTFIEPYWGVAPGTGFEELCAWLATAYGSDAFADRHWLSQHRHVALPRGRLPDFLGRYERLDEDVAAVARRVGLGGVALPHLNRSPEPADGGARLTARTRALLGKRYAADFDLRRAVG